MEEMLGTWTLPSRGDSDIRPTLRELLSQVCEGASGMV